MNEQEIADRIAADILSRRGQQRHRKDKDLMEDGGGTSKGRDREPHQKPPRDDLKKRYRKKRKTPSERDPDTDNDPDKRACGSLLRRRRDYGRQAADVVDLKSLSFEQLKDLAGRNGIPSYREEEVPVITFRDWMMKQHGLTDAEVMALQNAPMEMLDAQLLNAFPSGGFHTQRTKGKADNKLKRGTELYKKFVRLTEEFKRSVGTKTERIPLKKREQDMAWLRLRLKRRQRKNQLVAARELGKAGRSIKAKSIILTGPPGSGKSTLLLKLRDLMPVVGEAARDVIEEWNQQDKWGKGDLQEDIYKEALQRVESTSGDAIFDRTHIDGLAYGYVPKKPPEPIKDAEVWWLRARREWFKNDTVRSETFEEAEEIGERLKQAYRDLGYKVVDIEADDPLTWPEWARKKREKKAGLTQREAGRSIKAKISHWYQFGDKSILFMATKKWPAAYIRDMGDEYWVTDFFPQTKVKRLFEKDSEPFRKQVYVGPPGPMDWKDFLLWFGGRRGRGALLDKIQSGILTDDLIRMVSKKKRMSKAELVDFLVGKHNMPTASFGKVYGDLEFAEGGRMSQEKHGHWDLIYDAKASADVDDVKKMLDMADRFVSGKGFGALAYGDVVATNTLKGGRMAEYYPGEDSIRIRFGKASASRDSVRDLLHELGHRNLRKNISQAQKLEIWRKFGQKKAGRVDLHNGDIIEHRDTGDVMKIVGRKFSVKGGGKWIGVVEESPASRLEVSQRYGVPEDFVGVDWIRRGDSGSSEKQAWFSSAYATTDADEFYCELFADWVMGKAKEPAKTWMDEVHRG